MRRTLFTAVGLLIILGACKNNGQEAGIGPITTGDDCIVETGAGKVMGYNDAGIYTFKGVPYAKADRFMPPTGPNPWEGVKKTQVYGPQARQGQNMNWGGQPSDYDFDFQFKNEKSSEAYRMADKVSSAWIAFIKTGNPNCKELPAWEPFNPEENPTMVLDNTPELKKNHDAVLLKYW